MLNANSVISEVTDKHKLNMSDGFKEKKNMENSKKKCFCEYRYKNKTFYCLTVACSKIAYICVVEHFILHTTARVNFSDKNSGDNKLSPHH